MGKREQLDQIKADILSQNVCPDLANQPANLVMGEGSLDADIFFIGEAPGRQEDEQARPFVGAAGKKLNEQLQANGFDRADVFISNIVKYRPPNNRDPKPEEKAAFWPFLEREIALVDPKIIITLGRHSLSSFLEDVTISDVHGTPHYVDIAGKTRILLPMYHPSATIYNKVYRQALTDDFATVRSYL